MVNGYYIPFRTKILALALFCVLMVSQAMATDVGGDFGKSWLSSSEATSTSTNSNSATGSLWSWGSIPKGQMLINGTLEPVGGDAISFSPAFTDNVTPIWVRNSSSNSTGDSSSLSSIDDPWVLAQTTGRRVIF